MSATHCRILSMTSALGSVAAACEASGTGELICSAAALIAAACAGPREPAAARPKLPAALSRRSQCAESAPSCSRRRSTFCFASARPPKAAAVGSAMPCRDPGGREQRGDSRTADGLHVPIGACPFPRHSGANQGGTEDSAAHIAGQGDSAGQGSIWSTVTSSGDSMPSSR